LPIRRKYFCALLLSLVTLNCQIGQSQYPTEVTNQSADFSKLDIAGVMRHAMTKGLCQKVIKSQASSEEIEQLVQLFERLEQLDPPVGSEEKWAAVTRELVNASRSIARGQPAYEQLKHAANCNACHREHRPRR
jgi:hypothetical protein